MSPEGITLVVPMRNEERSLPVLLRSIFRQTRFPEEVILVDGGSSDGTAALARSLTKHDSRFQILEAGPASPGRGRNLGIAAAQHDWIALTDAGIELEPTWLESLISARDADERARVVYGSYEPVISSFLDRCAALVYVPPKQERGCGRARGPSTASMLLHRDVWRAVGGFPDFRASEDLIFFERIAEQGALAAWAPQATAWWQLQPTLARTFRKFVIYSKHNVWAGRQRYWHYGLLRQYACLVPFLLLTIVHHPAWLTVVLLWLLVRAGKSIWVRREGRGLDWLLNPIQWAGVAALLLVIDSASFLGWIMAKWQAPAETMPTGRGGLASPGVKESLPT